MEDVDQVIACARPTTNSLEFLEGLEHVHLKFLVLVRHEAKLGDECNVVNVLVEVADLGCKGKNKDAFGIDL